MDLSQELDTLQRLTTNELCEKYQQLYGQPVRTRHKAYLIRKVAWRMQALARGDLSERAKRRAEELANDADIRLMPPKTPLLAPKATPAKGVRKVAKLPPPLDSRLPSPGTAIVRQYKGQQLQVLVLRDGFEFGGQKYKTLTAVAEQITGTHINGFRFFKLEAR